MDLPALLCKKLLPSTAILWLGLACIPRPPGQLLGLQEPSGPATLAPGEPLPGPAAPGGKTPPSASLLPPGRTTIFALDKQTYRLLLRDELVWNAAIDVLMRNYNLTVVDRNNGIITTEWDSFYLNHNVYRNRVSLRLSRLTNRSCQLLISNNTEVLRDASVAGAGSLGAIWLPTDDTAGETARLLRNIATYLAQPSPYPPPVIAPKSGEKGDERYRGL